MLPFGLSSEKNRTGELPPQPRLFHNPSLEFPPFASPPGAATRQSQSCWISRRLVTDLASCYLLAMRSRIPGNVAIEELDANPHERFSRISPDAVRAEPGRTSAPSRSVLASQKFFRLDAG